MPYPLKKNDSLLVNIFYLCVASLWKSFYFPWVSQNYHTFGRTTTFCKVIWFLACMTGFTVCRTFFAWVLHWAIAIFIRTPPCQGTWKFHGGVVIFQSGVSMEGSKLNQEFPSRGVIFQPGVCMEGSKLSQEFPSRGVIFQPGVSMEGSKLSLEFPSKGGGRGWSFFSAQNFPWRDQSSAWKGVKGGGSFYCLGTGIFISVFIGKNKKIEKILSL